MKYCNPSAIVCLIFTGALLFSCSGNDTEVRVQYNTQFASEHKIVIDDTLTILKDISNNYESLLLKPGKHKLSIDSGIPEEFTISKNGGILNIAKEDFVIFPVKFTLGKEKVGESMYGIPNGILIDSFVVGSDSFFEIYAPGLKRNKIDSLSNGNDRTELLKISKGEIFIPKKWDIDIDEEIPKSLSESVSGTTKEATTFRTKVISAKEFLRSARETTGNFMAAPLSSFPD